jgi:hypothetical protein
VRSRRWIGTRAAACGSASLLALCALCALFAVGTTGAGAGERPRESWFFVIEAAGATADGQTIQLSGVQPRATGFTDRPRRETARFPVQRVVEQWDGLGFTQDPPNAAISWFDGEAEQTAIVELSQPQAVGDSVSFDYRILEGRRRPASRTGATVDELPATLEDVVVFVDKVRSIPVNDQMTD